MAELFKKKANDHCEFGCYSERGIMSYFMFVHLPNCVGEFLSDLQFSKGCDNPFSNLAGIDVHATIFSELDLGNKGFGKPDGAIFIDGDEPAMVMIEVKLNGDYENSCKYKKPKEYNSTLRGQLELKWRFSQSLNHSERNLDWPDYVLESEESKAVYSQDDIFYQHGERKDPSKLRSWRRLKRIDGVSDFLEYAEKCKDRFFYLAITDEPENPFDSVRSDLLPRCGNLPWSEVKHRFCWLPAKYLTDAGNSSSVLEVENVQH